MIRENRVLEGRLSLIEQLWERKKISDWEFEMLDTAARMISGVISYNEARRHGQHGDFWGMMKIVQKPKEFDSVLLKYQRRLV